MTTKDFIVRYVILKIALGQYDFSTLLPSENKLAEQFKTTRLTVRQAYNKLVEINVLKTKKGVGYFVNQLFFTCVYTPYASLLDKTLVLSEIIFLENKTYLYEYEIKFNNQTIGSLTINYKNKLLEVLEPICIDKLLKAFIIDSNLGWQHFFEDYSFLIDDKTFSSCHFLKTEFVDENHVYDLVIVTKILPTYFSYQKQVRIFD